MKKEASEYPSLGKPQNNGYSYFEKHPMIPNLSVYNAIRAINTFYGNKEAIDCLDLKVNYDQLFKDSITISRALKELNVTKGQIVSISMPNLYQAVASFLACNRIGAVTTFLNPGAEKEEISEYLNLFESPVFINYDKTDEENLIYKKKTNVKYIITLNKENKNKLSLNEDYHLTKNDELIDFNSLGSIAEFQKKGLPSNNSKDNSLILFTSGSTGKPKSVVLTNENILAAGTYLKNSSKSKSLDGDKTLVCVPFMYPYGFSTSTLMTLMSSKTAILAPNMSKDTISYYLNKKPNIIFGSPALLDLIMKNIPENQDLSSITTYVSGGDFLTPSHSKRGQEFFEKHGAKDVKMGNGSGNAETVSCGTNPTGVEIRPETAGKVLVGTDVMIVDSETLEEKKYNEEGLLCVSGKHVFKEYYKEPEKTKDAKFEKDGKTYFKTGTMGYIDKDGYFTLTGRESRFYIISTLNKVYCDHVQTIISNLDDIDECAIVKVPDDDMLYVNKAYIVPNKDVNDIELEKEKILEKFKQPIINSKGEIEQLKWYEIPSYIEFVKELPRKPGTEKVDYQTLEHDAEQKLTQRNNKSKQMIKKV
jgi:acyl-coA synthetases (AMP-forming)/AMP-acid ligases II